MRPFPFTPPSFRYALLGALIAALLPLPFAPQADSPVPPPSSKIPAPAYREGCQEICLRSPELYLDSLATEELDPEKLCVHRCVNERLDALIEGLAYGAQAGRCQHRINLAVLCLLAEPKLQGLSASQLLTLCTGPRRLAEAACTGRVQAPSLG